MVIFDSYVSLPEGNFGWTINHGSILKQNTILRGLELFGWWFNMV